MREDRVTMGLGRSPWRQRWLSFLICLFLALIVWAVFGQTRHYAFVNYDDDRLVYQNAATTQGLSLNGAVRAFTHVNAQEWYPLTSISHMLDWQLYGSKAGGHHLTNVVLHAATAIFLFLVFRSMTGALWPSAFVAAVFAVHPLRVESVAWVTERKDVLSGLFFMLTIWAYLRYAQKRGLGSSSAFSFLRAPFYWLALLLYALGLMAKTMLVTLPFVLLLLDYWPLGRFQSPQSAVHSRRTPARNSQIVNRILEKLPFLVLAAAACVATILAQRNAIGSVQEYDFPSRISNALVAYADYLRQMLYPVGLAVFYPHPGNRLPVWRIGLSALVLLFISVGVMAGRRNHPYLLVGWLWYLGMLVPVIGLIQVGAQARADRYTYLPQIGLYLLLTWLATNLCVGWRHRRITLVVVSTVVLILLLFRAYAQTTYWRDSQSLWTYACTSDNFFAQYNLAVALNDKGNVDEAIAHYQKALQLKPDFVAAHINLGDALLQKSKLAEAMAHFQRALQLKPDSVEAQNDLAWVLAASPEASLRDGKKAVELAQRANQLTLGASPAILSTLAAAYAEIERFPEAIETAQRALQLAEAQANTKLVNDLRSQMKRYQAGLPFRFQ
jgi:protein O-mannosyl-transferase